MVLQIGKILFFTFYYAVLYFFILFVKYDFNYIITCMLHFLHKSYFAQYFHYFLSTRDELGMEPGSEPGALYHVGQVIKCKVLASNPSSRKINITFNLSSKRLNSLTQRLS